MKGIDTNLRQYETWIGQWLRIEGLWIIGGTGGGYDAAGKARTGTEPMQWQGVTQKELDSAMLSGIEPRVTHPKT